MLTKLDRYLLKEMLSPFFLGLFILMFILISQQILKMMELVIDKGISLWSVGELFLRILPSFLVVTLPMAVMMASVTTFNRLSADNEIIALHAAGIGFSRVFKPVVIFAVVIALLTLSMGVMAGSRKGSLKSLAVKLLMQQASVGLEEGQFNGIFSNMMIYVESMPTFSEMKGVFIFDQRKPDAPVVIVAKEGVLVSDQATQTVGLHLVNGSLHQSSPKSDRHQKMTFANYDVKIDFSEMVQKQENVEGPSYAEIQARIAETKGEDKGALRLLSRFYRRFLFAVAALLFCLMGMPLGIISGRITRVGGFAAGIVMIMLYYMLMTLGDALIASRTAPPLAAAALPILILTPVCVYLLRKTATNVSPTLFGLSSKRP
ncbi:MAG: LptF/LptG family permease [Nitrospiria bacterium]